MSSLELIAAPPRPAREAAPGLAIELHDSVAGIGPQVWQAWITPQQYFRYDYMQALEASRLDCRFVYAVAREAGEVVGLMLAAIWRVRLPLGLSLRVMSTGSPLNIGLPLMPEPAKTGEGLARALLEALRGRAGELGVRLFVGRDLPCADFGRLPGLLRLYDCAWLTLRWPDFEAYLASRPRRKSLRRDLRAVEKAGFELELREEGVGPTPEEARHLHRLWLQLYDKHRSPDQLYLSEEFFMQMAGLPHAVWLLLRNLDGEIVAFDLCFALGDTLESTYCGVDLERCARLPVHRVMGYEIVRYALRRPRLRRINFGISNVQSKQDAGCEMLPQYGWIETRPRWLGALLRPLLLRFVLADSQPSPAAAPEAP
ncbi:GNAT family N-acetyltransferase [Roseateles sp. DAIF2]|uniref:GNAT family N-acetyltransferase n=1 Tax=Roseateles sp. DAIF2 TaxID=2714952 RepID=UPI0018A3263F|nr:GNAT family N-acetyltransferase [Roseateles sp. DAIF2]QPF73202.1 GNAT family N-acetyltransferase [Roseateles sp. DAIF2]